MSDIAIRDDDDLVPVEIEHRREEMINKGELEASYNYFIYHFDCDGRYFWARSYTDDIDKVTIYGPFTDRTLQRSIGGERDPRIAAYLRRRFKHVNWA